MTPTSHLSVPTAKRLGTIKPVNARSTRKVFVTMKELRRVNGSDPSHTPSLKSLNGKQGYCYDFSSFHLIYDNLHLLDLSSNACCTCVLLTPYTSGKSLWLWGFPRITWNSQALFGGLCMIRTLWDALSCSELLLLNLDYSIFYCQWYIVIIKFICM